MLRFVPDLAPDEPLRLLCLGAHSDDIEIGAGATVLRLLAERRSVEATWVVLSATPERRAEAKASAGDFLDGATAADIRVEGFRESYFPAQWETIKEAVEALKGVDPHLVLTHRRDDGHQDHRTVAELTWNTFRDHAIWEYEVPKYDGDVGRPNLFVPVDAEHAERKVALLMQHFRSQTTRRWFREETFRAVLAWRGVECNAPHGLAEAFHAHKVVV